DRIRIDNDVAVDGDDDLALALAHRAIDRAALAEIHAVADDLEPAARAACDLASVLVAVVARAVVDTDHAQLVMRIVGVEKALQRLFEGSALHADRWERRCRGVEVSEC